MISPIRNLQPPYRVPSGIIYFHDWRYVQHGSVGWRAASGERVPMWGTDPVPPMRYDPRNLPTGVRLRAKPAAKSEPILTSSRFEGLFLTSCTAMRDAGQYRLWVDASPVEHIRGADRPMGSANYIIHAESDDGIDWRTPSQGQIDRHGSTANPLVLGPPITDATGYHGGSVFLDPSAEPAERYKLFFQGWMPEDEWETYLRERADEVDAMIKTPHFAGLFGGVSPDGIDWRIRRRPLVAQVSDTQNVCEFDPALNAYVAYCRSWLFGRRTIARTASPDFERFPLSEDVIWPNALVEPWELWYSNAKTRMPRAPEYHLMFPMRWSLKDDAFDIHVASSPDNVTWGLVPGGAVCRPGEPGAWDGGVVGPGLGLIELPGDRLGIPIVATHVPHKHPRRLPFGAIAWATWRSDRIIALEAPVEGGFTLWPLLTDKRTVALNFKTAPAGSICLAVLGADGTPLPGRSFDDSDWLVGDDLAGLATWHGNPDLGHRQGEPVTLAVRMRCAELYAIEFR